MSLIWGLIIPVVNAKYKDYLQTQNDLTKKINSVTNLE